MKKLKNMIKKIYYKIKNNILIRKILLGLKLVIKEFSSPKGILSFLIMFIITSGTGCIITGYITHIKTLTAIGYSMLGFYFAPTFSLLINIILGLIFQRYILQDKDVSIKHIKEEINKLIKSKK